MEFKFIAVNGDNVGDSIGSAIATDNHEELSKITGGLKDAHGAIEQWIESVGGQVVTSSGDEGIYKIPAESYDEATIDSLRDQYSQSTGTTITVGVGTSMSEASKALIYGKLNEKDQVVEYDPHIDDYIAGHDDEIVEDEDSQDDGFTDQEAVGDEEYEDESASELVAPEGAQDENPEYQEEVPEMEETAVGGEAAIGETDETMPDSELDETLAEEGEMSEDDLDVAPEDRLDQVVGDLDGDGDVDVAPPAEEDAAMLGETDQETPIPEGDEVAQAQAEMGEEMPAEGMEGQMAPEGMEAPVEGEEMAPDEMAPEGMEGMVGEEMDEGMDPEAAMEGDQDNQSALTDMIHANMGGEEDASPADDEADEEELRQDIVTSLQTFKENKAMLEQAKQENPKLYEATILMLRSMIEMAKKLSMDPEGDVNAQMAQDALPEVEGEEEEGFEEEMSEEDVEAEEAEGLEEVEDSAEDDASQEDKEKNPFAKNEMTKLYADLLKGINIVKKAESRWDYWKRKEKEKAKKKAGQGKRINGKKPVDHALDEVERKMKVKKEVTSKKK